jgi:ubiquinol-cytochrome c reductase iron-sulfur subunit
MGKGARLHHVEARFSDPLAAKKGLKTVSHDTNSELEHPDRRDFLYIATGAAAAVGTAAAVWPFIDQMNPNAATRALASIQVDVSAIEQGQAITVKWRGKPVFLRNRTDREVEMGKEVPLGELKDKIARNANIAGDAEATDVNRSAGEGMENWIVMIGSCTHLGCVPVGTSGDYGGWFCPCHGSHYDTAGRIRKGPAPENLHIPAYKFVSDTTIEIG